MSDEDDKPVQRRRYYRLPYPEDAQPPFRDHDGRSYPVLELSEKSVVIAPAKGETWAKGDPVSGEILFSDGESETISGEVLRQDERGVVVLLSDGVTFHHVIKEQTFVKKHYPLFLRHR